VPKKSGIEATRKGRMEKILNVVAQQRMAQNQHVEGNIRGRIGRRNRLGVDPISETREYFSLKIGKMCLWTDATREKNGKEGKNAKKDAPAAHITKRKELVKHLQ